MLVKITEQSKKVDIRIKNNLKILFENKKNEGKTGYGFREYCKEKYGIDINVGNMHKLIHNENSKITPLILMYLCEYLEVDMEDVMRKNMNVIGEIFEEKKSKRKEYIDNFKVEKAEIERYLGQYNCYYYSLEDKIEEKILKGKLNIQYSDSSCLAKLIIDTEEKDSVNPKKNYIKEYTGRMIVSKRLNICFCILENNEIGEVVVISFRYKSALNNTKNKGGMAAVCSASSGGVNVPTMHRMLITRKNLNDFQLDKVKSNLLLNYSSILIEEKALKNTIESFEISEVGKKKIEAILDGCGKNYYLIKERNLRGISKEELGGHSTAEFIAEIRSKSYAQRYNKVSLKLDEQVLQLIDDMNED